MAKSLEVQLNPDLLVWARESMGIGIDAAARSIGIKPEKLASCEVGEAYLTFAQLKKAADSYKRSLGVFFLPKPPEEPAPLPDFRMPLDKRGTQYSKYLLLEMRRARRRRTQLLDLAVSLDIGFQNFSISCSIDETPTEVAGKARRYLDVSLEDQFSWRGEYKALNSWVAAIENKDILVFQAQRIPTDEMSGFCVYFHILPIIVLNSAYKPNGKIFTLLHEFVHLMVRTSGVSDAFSVDKSSHSPDDIKALEKFCNSVAAEIILPRTILAENFNSSLNLEECITSLSSKFSVSRETVARKLNNDGLISDADLGQQIAEIYRGYEAAKKAALGKKGFIHPITRVVRDNGRTFTSTVVASYERGIIDDHAFREYLGADSNTTSDIKNIIRSKSYAHAESINE